MIDLTKLHFRNGERRHPLRSLACAVVLQALKDALPPPSHGRTVRTAENEAIAVKCLALADSGKTAVEIGQELGIPRTKVGDLLGFVRPAAEAREFLLRDDFWIVLAGFNRDAFGDIDSSIRKFRRVMIAITSRPENGAEKDSNLCTQFRCEQPRSPRSKNYCDSHLAECAERSRLSRKRKKELRNMTTTKEDVKDAISVLSQTIDNNNLDLASRIEKGFARLAEEAGKLLNPKEK